MLLWKELIFLDIKDILTLRCVLALGYCKFPLHCRKLAAHVAWLEKVFILVHAVVKTWCSTVNIIICCRDFCAD